MGMSTGTGKVVQTLPERTADDLLRGDVITEIGEKFGRAQLGRDGIVVVFGEEGAVTHYAHIRALTGFMAEHGHLAEMAFAHWKGRYA